MKNVAYYNGEYSTIEELKIPMLDRAVYFGDGVYDVVMIKDGKYFALEDHLDRFYNSCRFVDINPPMDREALKGVLAEMLDRSDYIAEGMLYWQASRGTAKRNHIYGEGMKSNLLAYVSASKFPDCRKPMKAITVEDNRYTLCNVKTINLIANVMASEKADRAGCGEAVFIRDGIVTECSHSNVHILKDGKLITHPLDCHILPGIARKHIIELCGKLGIPVEEREYTKEELFDADEILISSTTKCCCACNELDGKPVGGKDFANLTRIQDAFDAKIENELD